MIAEFFTFLQHLPVGVLNLIIVFLIVVIMMMVLMALRWHLFPALLAGAVLIAVFSQKSALYIGKLFVQNCIDWSTLNLLLMVFLINFLAQIMKKVGGLSRFASGAEYLLRGSRLGVASIPMFVGLLPMPGGSLMTAPMIEEQAKPHNIKPGLLVYINYWFRHVWEYFWPLYPGVILVLAVVDIPYKVFFRNVAFISIAAVVLGLITLFAFVRRRQERPKRVRGKLKQSLKDILYGVFPVLLIMVLIATLQIPFSIPVSLLALLVIVIVIIVYKVSIKDLPLLLAKAFNWGVLAMLFAILFFRRILISSNALSELKVLLETASPAAITLLVILLPFFVGLLVGLNQGYVGATFPLLASFISHDYGLLMLAYVFGFMGCLLSPAHLCLYLSKDYFKASWGGVYKWLLPSVLGLGIIAFGAFYLFFR